MLNHIVIFRRKMDVESDPVLSEQLIKRMDALGAQIESVRGWSLQANIFQRPVSWDYALESSFDDEAGLNAYLQHPLHVALVADLKLYFEWAAVDYVV